MKQGEQGKLLSGMIQIGDATFTEFAHHLHSGGHDPTAIDLQAAAMTTRIPMRKAQWIVTNGPFAETHELLGG